MKRAILIATLAAAAIAASATQAAAQSATPRCSPAPADCSGWYARDVTLSWSFQGAPTDARGCELVTFRVDGVFARTCSVSGDGVNFNAFPVTIHVDKTAPSVTGVAPSRGPDTNGWYRAPVEVRFFGDDGLSGVASCSSGTYGGPDAAAAEVLGRCWDRAGNVSAPGTFGLRYDATPPSLAGVKASGRDHKVRLKWSVPDATSVEVSRVGTRRRNLVAGETSGRFVDRRRRNGHRYRYLVTATDAAGNTASRTLTVVPGPRLLGPAAGATVVGPPRLRWTKVRGAEYYNVQLFRGRRKILSAWPEKPRLQLSGKWRYAGHKRRLKPGRRYRWFVWPGEGERSRNQYGPLIGRRSFVVAP
jgi:hypothetical protein